MNAIGPDGIRKVIPDQVIEAFNELITKYYYDGLANFTLDEAITLVCKKVGCSREKPCEEHWMDVERIYIEKGWHVEFDNPAFNETYPATFYFSRRR